MAHLWKLNDDRAWVASALLDDLRLVESDSRAVLLRPLSEKPGSWAIVTDDPASVRVNGAPLSLGIAVLTDRDQIRIDDWTVWFSTEMRPSVEPLPDSAARGSCPRCKQPLTAGRPAVRCPFCGVWHHQQEDDELTCWSYDTTCGGCRQQLTALDAPFRWSPEDL